MPRHGAGLEGFAAGIPAAIAIMSGKRLAYRVRHLWRGHWLRILGLRSLGLGHCLGSLSCYSTDIGSVIPGHPAAIAIMSGKRLAYRVRDLWRGHWLRILGLRILGLGHCLGSLSCYSTDIGSVIPGHPAAIAIMSGKRLVTGHLRLCSLGKKGLDKCLQTLSCCTNLGSVIPGHSGPMAVSPR
jgi:hypothetical protein